MNKIIIGFLISLCLLSCSKGTDDPGLLEAYPEPPEWYFTFTNVDSQYAFSYMGGLICNPSETTQTLTLIVEKYDYIIYWIVDGEIITQIIPLDMTGKPEGSTINYTVKYEE